MQAGWTEKWGRPNCTESPYVYESGQVGSPAIIFLHGVGTSAGIWKEHMERFAGFHAWRPVELVEGAQLRRPERLTVGSSGTQRQPRPTASTMA